MTYRRGGRFTGSTPVFMASFARISVSACNRKATTAAAEWGKPAAADKASPAPVKRGTRVSVYWTEMDQWFTGTLTTSRVEPADNGGEQRACCVVYDAVGPWATCNKPQLTYWHCLDDEQWKCVE